MKTKETTSYVAAEVTSSGDLLAAWGGIQDETVMIGWLDSGHESLEPQPRLHMAIDDIATLSKVVDALINKWGVFAPEEIQEDVPEERYEPKQTDKMALRRELENELRESRANRLGVIQQSMAALDTRLIKARSSGAGLLELHRIELQMEYFRGCASAIQGEEGAQANEPIG